LIGKSTKICLMYKDIKSVDAFNTSSIHIAMDVIRKTG